MSRSFNTSTGSRPRAADFTWKRPRRQRQTDDRSRRYRQQRHALAFRRLQGLGSGADGRVVAAGTIGERFSFKAAGPTARIGGTAHGGGTRPCHIAGTPCRVRMGGPLRRFLPPLPIHRKRAVARHPAARESVVGRAERNQRGTGRTNPLSLSSLEAPRASRYRPEVSLPIGSARFASL